MALIKAQNNALKSTFSGQWKQFYCCDSISTDQLAVAATRRITDRFGGVKTTSENVISYGSVAAVSDGQYLIITENGKIVASIGEPGEYVFTDDANPTIMGEGLTDDAIKSLARNALNRLRFGGMTAKEHRVYYINTKEIIGCKFGTPAPIPVRVVDDNIGLDMDMLLTCYGEYTFRITDPVRFFSNVCGNFSGTYARSQLEGTLRSEILSVLQPAFAAISSKGVRYSELANMTGMITEAINAYLSEKWSGLRGIRLMSISFNSIRASDEDEALLRKLQADAAKRNRRHEDFQNNPVVVTAGKAAGFIENIVHPKPAEPENDAWQCVCGTKVSGGKFCHNCGKPRPEGGWKCECGMTNFGNFCPQCGRKRPSNAPLYRCDKCGWQPEDPAHPPRFCPQCGDRFDDGDIVN